MNGRWHFYDKGTGLFVGRTYAGPQEGLAGNTPPGHAAASAVMDPLSQKVDLASGAVVDYQPPQPSPDHEWDTTAKRWGKSAASSANDQERRVALARINYLEGSLQMRLVREAALGYDGAKARLQAIDEEIIALRPKIARVS